MGIWVRTCQGTVRFFWVKPAPEEESRPRTGHSRSQARAPGAPAGGVQRVVQGRSSNTPPGMCPSKGIGTIRRVWSREERRKSKGRPTIPENHAFLVVCNSNYLARRNRGPLMNIRLAASLLFQSEVRLCKILIHGRSKLVKPKLLLVVPSPWRGSRSVSCSWRQHKSRESN